MNVFLCNIFKCVQIQNFFFVVVSVVENLVIRKSIPLSYIALISGETRYQLLMNFQKDHWIVNYQFFFYIYITIPFLDILAVCFIT